MNFFVQNVMKTKDLFLECFIQLLFYARVRRVNSRGTTPASSYAKPLLSFIIGKVTSIFAQMHVEDSSLLNKTTQGKVTQKVSTSEASIK